MNEKTTTRCLIGEVRFSYCHIFQPEAASEGAEKKYSVSLIIPKTDTRLLQSIRAAIEAAKAAGAAKFGGRIPASLKTPLRDGEYLGGRSSAESDFGGGQVDLDAYDGPDGDMPDDMPF